MLKRAKKALVDSFVGAIAVAWLLADGIMSLVASFTAPLNDWLLDRMRWRQSPAYSRIVEHQPRFPFEMAIPELVAAILLLLLAYLLFRWLYLESPQRDRSHGAREPAV